MSDSNAARALLGAAADELCDKIAAIARDHDDATKMSRAADLVAKTVPEVSALVMLALFASLDECEEKVVTYERLLAKLTARMLAAEDA